jgi:transcriptional regulator
MVAKGKDPGSAAAGGNLYGNLSLLILQTVEVEGPIHGLGVLEAIRATSEGGIQVDDAALYRSLHRLEARGLLSAEWRISEKNRRAKFYALTRAGRKELDRARSEWTRHTQAVCRVLGLSWEVKS